MSRLCKFWRQTHSCLFWKCFSIRISSCRPFPPLLSGLLEAAQEFHHCHLFCIHKFTEPLKALLTQVSAPKCPPFSPSPYPFLTCWAPECPPPTIPVRGLSLRGSLLPHLRSTTRLSHTIQYHSKPYHTIPYKFIPYNTKPHHTIPSHTVSHLEPLHSYKAIKL